MTKTCKTCKTKKSLSDFWKGKGSQGRCAHCKECLTEIRQSGRSTRQTLEERYWEKVAKAGDDECWPWTAATDPDGYGLIGGRGTTLKAHRLAWEFSTGKPPGRGICVCHTCDTPQCLNPKHLFLGTHGDNARDKAEKLRAPATLTPELVGQIRKRYAAGGARQIDLANEFGVSQSLISAVVRREVWAHV